MKKILPVLLLLFAFSFTANAQSEKAKLEIQINNRAKENLYELSQVVDLTNNPDLFEGLRRLFIDKHTNLSKEGITEAERKTESERVKGKLIGSLKEEQINKLKQLGLFEKLIN